MLHFIYFTVNPSIIDYMHCHILENFSTEMALRMPCCFPLELYFTQCCTCYDFSTSCLTYAFFCLNQHLFIVVWQHLWPSCRRISVGQSMDLGCLKTKVNHHHRQSSWTYPSKDILTVLNGWRFFIKEDKTAFYSCVIRFLHFT